MASSNYFVTAPLKVKIRVNKYFTLNLNQYRNTNFFLLNKAKKVFEETVREQIEKLPKFESIQIRYLIIAGSKRNFDIMNFGSVADKFFCDSLVKFGKIKDDSYDYITDIAFSYGGVEKGKQRFIAEIIPLKISS